MLCAVLTVPQSACNESHCLQPSLMRVFSCSSNSRLPVNSVVKMQATDDAHPYTWLWENSDWADFTVDVLPAGETPQRPWQPARCSAQRATQHVHWQVWEARLAGDEQLLLCVLCRGGPRHGAPVHPQASVRSARCRVAWPLPPPLFKAAGQVTRGWGRERGRTGSRQGGHQASRARHSGR